MNDCQWQSEPTLTEPIAERETVIGMTMTVTDKVVPGMVGVDIGCGMETAVLDDSRINFSELDALIRSEIPSGRDIRDSVHQFADETAVNNVELLLYLWYNENGSIETALRYRAVFIDG